MAIKKIEIDVDHNIKVFFKEAPNCVKFTTTSYEPFTVHDDGGAKIDFERSNSGFDTGFMCDGSSSPSISARFPSATRGHKYVLTAADEIKFMGTLNPIPNGSTLGEVE